MNFLKPTFPIQIETHDGHSILLGPAETPGTVQLAILASPLPTIPVPDVAVLNLDELLALLKALYVEHTVAKDLVESNQQQLKNQNPDKPFESLIETFTSLLKFKQYVHKRLDAAGVPHDPDPLKTKKTGCRIGSRLDYVFRAAT